MVSAVAVDDSFIAWGGSFTEPPVDAGVWVARKGGGATIFVAPEQAWPIGGISLRDGYVYWTHGQPQNTLMRAPLDGGPHQTLGVQLENALSLKTTATHLYWAAQQAGEIRRIPLGGGPIEAVVTGQLSPTVIALDNSYLYWAGNNGVAIQRIPLSGGSPSLLYTGSWATGGLAVAGGFVYGSEDSAMGRVSRGPVQGGAAQTIAIDQDVPRQVNSDGERAYWVTSGSNFAPSPRLHSAPLDGGARVQLLSIRQAGLLVLDRTDVYFSSGSLWRLPK